MRRILHCTAIFSVVLLAIRADYDAVAQDESLEVMRVASKASPSCGEKAVAVVHETVGRAIVSCGRWQDVHWELYRHESLSLPALALLGERGKQALVLGGANGGVAAQLLQSKDIQRVVLVSDDEGLMELAAEFDPKSYEAFRDSRLKVVVQLPSLWLQEALQNHSAGFLASFDLVVVDIKENLPEQQFITGFDPGDVEALLNPGGLLVHSATSLWHLAALQVMFQQLGEACSSVAPLQFSVIAQVYNNDADYWHDVAFMAGGPGTDFFQVDWAWWHRQEFSTVLYRPEKHQVLLTPSAILSRALGLNLPRQPDQAAALQANSSARPEVSTLPACMGQGRSALTQVLGTATGFQNLRVFRSEDTRCTVLELDGELQLTNIFGDFYHEAMVHPVMAALGPRGKRVLVIGAGDGGVASVLLKYPQVEAVVQVEIDEAVVRAAREYLPEMSYGYDDPRHELLIMDAMKWVKRAAKTHSSFFDLCIIDSTDEPVTRFGSSVWSPKFYRRLKRILAPGHGAVVQNVGTHGIWLQDQHDRFSNIFRNVSVINVNTPDYPSPYLLFLATDDLNTDSEVIDWEWWSALNLDTIYYHPTMHQALLTLPYETHLLVASKFTQHLHWDHATCRSLEMSRLHNNNNNNYNDNNNYNNNHNNNPNSSEL
ncbi:unnamed protein product [Polarella glacialis]|uniref:PABS domain-containing protein n=1 Tax=Polarella glacialis TaxID=89957 RepID=A0A813GT55_POLGL|nr:unnamed protein product [Polarella glacialis]